MKRMAHINLPQGKRELIERFYPKGDLKKLLADVGYKHIGTLYHYASLLGIKRDKAVRYDDIARKRMEAEARHKYEKARDILFEIKEKAESVRPLVGGMNAMALLEEGDSGLFLSLIELITDVTKAVSDAGNAILDGDGSIEAEGKRMAEEEKRQKEEYKKGAKWSCEEILRHCELVGNVIKLPNVQFNRESYDAVKRRIEEAGGHWEGKKTQGFVFPFDATNVFKTLQEGGDCGFKKDFQFFETPAELADWIVSMAGPIGVTDTILEPSAGTGAIIKAIHRAFADIKVSCCEVIPEFREILGKMPNVEIVGTDFAELDGATYSKIIANPPFSHNRDIDHVRRMYDRLKPNGVLCSIMSMHWTFAQESPCEDFRQWLDKVGGEEFPVPAGVFNESGTNISTCAIRVKKSIETPYFGEYTAKKDDTVSTKKATTQLTLDL